MPAAIWCRMFLLPVVIETHTDYKIHSSNFACCLYGHETLSVTLREEYRLKVLIIGCSWEDT